MDTIHHAQSEKRKSNSSAAVAAPYLPSLSPVPAMQILGGCDTIVAGSSILTAMFRRLAIRRTSQGFEVVHRFAGEWLGVSYPARVRKSLTAANADLSAHAEKDADRRRDRT